MMSLNVAATPLRVQRNKPAARAPARSALARPCVASAAAAGNVPDMGKRNTMNLLLLGAIGLPGLPLAGGFAYFFVPPRWVALEAQTLPLQALGLRFAAPRPRHAPSVAAASSRLSALWRGG
jgi:hypothetical protein